MVPGEDGGGAAVGAPGFGEFADFLFGRAAVEAEDAADFDLDREVARWKDIGAPFGEEEIDFGTPAADPLDVGQRCDRFLIVGGEVREIEPARQHVLGEALHIRDFLARQAGGAQILVAGGGDFGRIVGAAGRLTLRDRRRALTLTCWLTIARSGLRIGVGTLLPLRALAGWL